MRAVLVCSAVVHKALGKHAGIGATSVSADKSSNCNYRWTDKNISAICARPDKVTSELHAKMLNLHYEHQQQPAGCAQMFRSSTCSSAAVFAASTGTDGEQLLSIDM